LHVRSYRPSIIRKLHVYLYVAQDNIICRIRPYTKYNILKKRLPILCCLRLIRHINVPQRTCFGDDIFCWTTYYTKQHIMFNKIFCYSTYMSYTTYICSFWQVKGTTLRFQVIKAIIVMAKVEHITNPRLAESLEYTNIRMFWEGS